MTKDEALKLALEACEGIVNADWRKWEELASPEEFERWVKSRANHTAVALREALAQPEQKPVAWSYWQSCLNDDGTQTAPWVPRLCKFKPTESIINKDVTPLYTTPPQRTWVGLTDEEANELTRGYSDDAITLMYETEAKLKEKNT